MRLGSALILASAAPSVHVHVWSDAALRKSSAPPFHPMNPVNVNPMRVQPLSRRAELVLTIASRLAGSDSRTAITPLDLMKATLGLGSGVAWYVLTKQGVHLEQGELILADLGSPSQDPRPRHGMDRAATSALYQAELETRMRNLTYVSVECLLYGVLAIDDAEVARYLSTYGTSIKAVRELLEPALLVS